VTTPGGMCASSWDCDVIGADLLQLFAGGTGPTPSCPNEMVRLNFTSKLYDPITCYSQPPASSSSRATGQFNSAAYWRDADGLHRFFATERFRGKSYAAIVELCPDGSYFRRSAAPASVLFLISPMCCVCVI
jgi:hypothetical protein